MKTNNISEVMRRAQEALPSVEEAAARLNELSAILTGMEQAKDTQPELFHGYTMDQWHRIMKGGYLCEFWDGHCSDQIFGLLVDFDTICNFPFKADFASYDQCRPAQRYGVLAPHFGGGKPEWLKDDDLLVYAKQVDGSTLGNTGPYAFVSSYDWSVITEFITMPGAPK